MIMRPPLLACMATALAITSLHAQRWEPQPSNTTAELRGVSAVSRRVAWASGSRGTVLRTIDGGSRWSRLVVPESDSLDFRDIHAFDEQRAVILAIGPGDRSRIYETRDGGMTWALRFRNDRKEAFFDCVAFWDGSRGIAVSDPVDGKFVLILTNDGGATWAPVAPAGIPLALLGEGAFAASGTCVAVDGRNDAWFVTGGVAQPRVFHSRDGGTSWTVATAPLAGASAGAGIFSIAFRGPSGVVVGGDYEKPTNPVGTVAVSSDGGATWRESPAPRDSLPRGYRSAVAFTKPVGRTALVATGTSGSDYSANGGLSWVPMDTVGYNALSAAPDGAVWAVGPRGRIAFLATVRAALPMRKDP